MRLHRLVIEGIGPYAKRQELDLDRLAEHGLFLLTGPTGAGKSTVLDAIVFALFGAVAGARGGQDKHERHRAKRGIVSDLRAIETTPLVELEFTAGARRLLVRRTPEHERPALRGSGTTLGKQEASLSEWVDGDWEPCSTDFAEISGELQDLLGMNADQFAQVVLLPQGQFAGFLRAPVKERRAILERLFRVDRYQAAERWLEDAARLARDGEAQATTELRELVAHLAGALGSRAGALPEAELPAVTAWVEQQCFDAEGLVEVTGVDLTAARSSADAASAALQRAATAVDTATALARRKEELGHLQQRLERAASWIRETPWAAHADDRRHWPQAVAGAQQRAATLQAAARDAQRAADLEARATEAAEAAAEAGEAALRAQATLPALQAALEAAHQATTGAEHAARELPVVEREHERLQSQLAALGRVLELEARRTTLSEQLATAEQQVRAAGAALADLPTPAALDADGRALAAAEREAATAHAAAQAAVSDAERSLAELRQQSARIDALTSRRAPLAAAAERAIATEQRQRDDYLAAREARLEAMAAELAAGLDEGAPCPVCGSADHPSPAAPHAGGDLRAAEDAAGERSHQAVTQRSAAEQAVATLDAELAALSASTLPSRSAAADAQLQTTRTASAGAAATLQACGEALLAHGERVAVQRAAAEQAAAAQQAAGAAREAVAGLDQQLADARARMPEDSARAKLGRDALAKQIAQLRAAALAAPQQRDAVRAAEHALEAARTEASRQRESAAGQRQAAATLTGELAALREGLAAHGAGPDLAAAAEAASVTAEHLRQAERLASSLPGVERDVARLVLQLAELQDADPDAVSRADAASFAAGARASHAAALSEAQQAATQLGTTQQAAADAERCQAAARAAGERLTELAARLGPAAAEAEQLRRLDATVRGQGDNTRRMSLTTYVLAARLEQVAAAATTHLERMSSGRYALRHHDERYGNGPAGLGLRVRDAWSGEERDTATLSGGESFQASLALALGLAEVVQHEAGGRRLETLLVDEGFGSLDPAALEEVLAELDELRASGRAIGLVSHVPALAERIPSQLRVTPSRAGSTAEVVLGAYA